MTGRWSPRNRNGAREMPRKNKQGRSGLAATEKSEEASGKRVGGGNRCLVGGELGGLRGGRGVPLPRGPVKRGWG